MVPVLFWIQNCLEIGLSLGQILENQVFLKPFEKLSGSLEPLEPPLTGPLQNVEKI